MPTPIAPGVVRVQAILQGRTGLPEDRFVSTYHFTNPTRNEDGTEGVADELHLQDAIRLVKQFYLTATTSTAKIADYLGPQVLRGISGLQLRAYHLGDPEPREPYIDTGEILGTVPTTGLPAEVAVVASFSGDRPLPRNRGRVYIGPLNNSVTTVEAGTGRVLVMPMMRETIQAAMLRMATPGGMDPAAWCVYSPTNNATTKVTQGYVDDGFDTQRRRGMKPINRHAFTVPS